MRYESLIEQALKAPTGLQIALAREGNRDPAVPLGLRPISSYESWRDIVLVGAHNDWNPRLALQRLNVEEVSFVDDTNTRHGYSIGRRFAISPNTPRPLGTLFHELGHIALKHTFDVPDQPEHPLQEVQAETVSFCCQVMIGAFTREGMYASRHYINHFHQRLTEPLEDRDITMISNAVTTILEAGSTDLS